MLHATKISWTYTKRKHPFYRAVAWGIIKACDKNMRCFKDEKIERENGTLYIIPHIYYVRINDIHIYVLVGRFKFWGCFCMLFSNICTYTYSIFPYYYIYIEFNVIKGNKEERKSVPRSTEVTSSVDLYAYIYLSMNI